MKKALRIGYNKYYREDNFKEHLEYIKKNLEVIDEITLYSEFGHVGYWDLDWSRNNAEILKDRIARYREVGVKSVGINILNTIGHVEEGWDVFPKTDLQYVVFADGSVSKAKLCIANQAYLDYVSARYSLYANTGTDFIWMDDDIRPTNCLCDSCIARFNKSQNTNYSRDELAGLLNTDTAVKKAWMDLYYDDFITLVKTINKAVKSVDSNIKIGYMSIGGNDVVEWMEASGAEKGRPGGGFYDDRTPLAVFNKCLYLQVAKEIYPKQMTDIQYEYEACNYQPLNRSVHFTELESTLALMNGCNGVLYSNDSFYDRQSLTDMLASSAKKWEVLTNANSGLKPAGVYCEGFSARTLCELGIPYTFNFDNAAVVFATGDGLSRLDDEKIKDFLTKGLLTDGKGVEILCDRGFNEAIGGKVNKVYDNGMAERFTDHPLNGEYANYYRDVYMNFVYYINNTGCAYSFTPAEDSEIISNLETITHNELDCSFYIAGNNKFAADGYLFPNSLNTTAKRTQLTNVIDRISGEKLPILLECNTKIMPCVNSNSDGDMTIMLTNACFDESGTIKCTVRNDKDFYIISDSGELVPAMQNGNVITIENIKPWDYVLLTNIK